MLILDEATSALDDITQQQVAATVAGLSAPRIVIAHRPSSIKAADRIVVMDVGRVVQSGTYDELAREPGPFAKLDAQASGGAG